VTDLHTLETTMLDSLAAITTQWDAMLEPTTSGGTGGSQSARITADDHADTEADIDRTTRIVSLRRFTVDVLNGWSRVVMEDRPVTSALPDGSSAPSMVEFLQRHAQWMSGHEAAEDCAGELGDVAKRITAMVAPHRKEWHVIGTCPLKYFDRTDDADAVLEVCDGRVRVPVGGDQSEASCTRCDTKAAVTWWEDVMGKAVDEESVRATEVAHMLAQRLKMTVTERTIRNWARDERITVVHQFGPQPKTPRYWFNPRVVLDQVAHMDRECPMCGRVWSGQGEVCARCYHAMQEARPQHAEPKVRTPAPRNLRPVRVVPDRHDTDRPERCHFSDLPLTQCACGRNHERTSA